MSFLSGSSGPKETFSPLRRQSSQEAKKTLIRIRFAPSKKERLRLWASFASDDARPSDYFVHETPNPRDGQITQLAANAC